MQLRMQLRHLELAGSEFDEQKGRSASRQEFLSK
jgi:hypothetical protein